MSQIEVFKLLGTIAVDGSKAEKELKDVIGKGKETESKLLSSFKKIGAAVATYFATERIVTFGATLTRTAVQAYADYEQLVGGVETLFKESQGIVMNYAHNAYKTAGMSANEYMETVTSFSASLLQSLGGDTAKAAEVADIAITDMSDNANKMGTSMEMIQNAYQGFAKQNYTMLDNLKLGYGGTKEEMERLIKDANKVKEANGEMADLSISSFADVVEAVHIMQTEMGITGTTAKEASTTIQGSMSSMKSAWKNLLVGIADGNQDLEDLWEKLWKSIQTAASNLLPRIKTTLKGFGDLVKQIVPPKAIDNVKKLAKALEVALGAMVAFKAAAKIQSIIVAFQEAQVALALYAATTEGASIAQGVMNGTLTVGETLVGLLTGKITLAEIATALWNNTIMANPLAIFAAAITAAVAAMVIFGDDVNWSTNEAAKLNKELEKSSAKMDEYKNKMSDLAETRKKTIEDGVGELNYYQGLNEELSRLVDENGRVKEGYESRAEFIVTTLNEALGAEIEMNNGVIDSYGQVAGSIDAIIEKKKAEIILKAYEEEYAEAIKNRATAYDQVVDAQASLDAAEKDYYANYSNRSDNMNKIMWDKVEEAKQAYATAVEDLNTNSAVIVGYEQMQADAVEGKVESIIAFNGDWKDSMKDVTKVSREEIQKQIEELEKHKSESIKLYNSTHNEIYKTEADGYDKQLKQLKAQLKAMKKSTEEVDFFSSGKSIIDGIYNGLGGEREQRLYKKARSIANTISNTINKALDIHSPSKVMVKIGQFITEGLSIGIEDKESMAIKAMKKISDSVIDNTVDTVPIPTLGDVQPKNYNAIRSFTRVSDNVQGNKFDQILLLLNLYLPMLEKLQDRIVVLDTGALVGGLMPEIDDQMGMLLTGKERGR